MNEYEIKKKKLRLKELKKRYVKSYSVYQKSLNLFIANRMNLDADEFFKEFMRLQILHENIMIIRSDIEKLNRKILTLESEN